MPDQFPVISRPIHNVDGTIRSLARQMLADLDRGAINTTVPTAQLALLLETLTAALDRPAPPMHAATGGLLAEAAVAPPVRPSYWRPRSDLAADE